MNCKQLPWITKKKGRNKQTKHHNSHVLILCASFWWERRTDEVSDFIYDSSDLPSSQQSWRHSCFRPGDPSCAVPCCVQALRQFCIPTASMPTSETESVNTENVSGEGESPACCGSLWWVQGWMPSAHLIISALQRILLSPLLVWPKVPWDSQALYGTCRSLVLDQLLEY